MYLERKPSKEKMERGIKLIEAVYDQLEFFDEGTRGPDFLKRYPNWKTDYGDYAGMIKAARKIAGGDWRYKKEARGIGGMGGQNITAGIIVPIGKYRIDYMKIFEKAVEIIHEREKAQGISEEEMDALFSIDKDDKEGLRKAIDYIKSGFLAQKSR